MKGLVKNLPSIVLMLLIILSSSLSLHQATVSEYTIYTRITEIVLPTELVYRESYPNWTFFEFDYTLEIINPSGRILYIVSHTTCLVFMRGNVSLDNKHYSGHIGGTKFCGDAFTNHTIIPGISAGTLTSEISVNDTLTILPNGNYTVWISLDDSEEKHSYYNFTSEIIVNGSEIQIIHNGANATFTFPEEPSPTTEISYSFLVTLYAGILVSYYNRKRNSKSCKNAF